MRPWSHAGGAIGEGPIGRRAPRNRRWRHARSCFRPALRQTGARPVPRRGVCRGGGRRRRHGPLRPLANGPRAQRQRRRADRGRGRGRERLRVRRAATSTSAGGGRARSEVERVGAPRLDPRPAKQTERFEIEQSPDEGDRSSTARRALRTLLLRPQEHAATRRTASVCEVEARWDGPPAGAAIRAARTACRRPRPTSCCPAARRCAGRPRSRASGCSSRSSCAASTLRATAD